MYKQIRLWTLVALVALAAGCKPKTEDVPSTLNVMSTKVDFTASKGEKDVEVQSNSKWTVVVEPKADWLTAIGSEGKVKLTATENTTISERKANVVITVSSNLKKTIEVTQAGIEPSISVEKAEYTMAADEKNLSIPVVANAATWTAEVSKDATWLTVAKNENNVVVTAQPNEEKTERVAVITLTLGAKNTTVTVKQAGKNDPFPAIHFSQGLTRKEVKEMMQKEGLTLLQDKYKANWMPEGSDGFTVEEFNGNLIYKAPNSEVKYIVFIFPRSTSYDQNNHTIVNENDKLIQEKFINTNGKTMNIDLLGAVLEQNGFSVEYEGEQWYRKNSDNTFDQVRYEPTPDKNALGWIGYYIKDISQVVTFSKHM